MLPPPGTSEDDEEADDDDETLRDIYLTIIRLLWVQAQSRLESMEQELELLHNAPPLAAEQSNQTGVEDAAWRLDISGNMRSSDGNGPLMDSSGRVSRVSVHVI